MAWPLFYLPPPLCRSPPLWPDTALCGKAKRMQPRQSRLQRHHTGPTYPSTILSSSVFNSLVVASTFFSSGKPTGNLEVLLLFAALLFAARQEFTDLLIADFVKQDSPCFPTCSCRLSVSLASSYYSRRDDRTRFHFSSFILSDRLSNILLMTRVNLACSPIKLTFNGTAL